MGNGKLGRLKWKERADNTRRRLWELVETGSSDENTEALWKQADVNSKTKSNTAV